MAGHLFTSESVTEGHPDKICDAVSDAVLDACLAQDPHSRVAAETMVKTGYAIVAGEITTQATIDVPEIVRKAIRKIGYTSSDMGFDADTCAVLSAVEQQSPDISQGVTAGQGLHKEQGAGDQGLMFGYAVNETRSLMPMPIDLAHRLTKRLAKVRKNKTLPWLRPDGKSQVTVEYGPDGKPTRIDAVVISTQHAEGIKHRHLKHAILDEVVHPVLPGKMVDKKTKFHINPTGRFVIGGPCGDAGLTGRKIIVDTYGGMGRHGGGAFSGKDPTKVDRSAAYACRWMAKSVVKAGLCKRALVQLSYAIGVAKPLSLFVETYGTENGNLTAKAITDIVKINFDARPGALARDLALREPKYNVTAAYCHFGREPYTKDGIRYFSWEDPIDLSKYAGMSTAQIEKEVSSNKAAILKKWVD